jgi:hypothetical protein
MDEILPATGEDDPLSITSVLMTGMVTERTNAEGGVIVVEGNIPAATLQTAVEKMIP